jgi:Prealbumin-like fold domain
MNMRRRLLLVVCGTLAIAAMMLTQQRPVNAANPAADLDQCRNGDQLHPVPCTGAAWVNGNAGASNAHWNEGDSIAYRMRFSNLATGAGNPHTLIIEWDTTQSGKHALDYITSVDRSVVADPCSGVAGCTLSNAVQIPADPVVQGLLTDSNAAGRWNQQMRLYNAGTGTISGILNYSLDAPYTGNSSTRVTITFTTSTPNPILAWGGHIATRQDWDVNNSAIAISGSPYHMRLVSLDGSGGNQDRSLSSQAAIFPATLTIIKDVRKTDNDDTTSNTEFTFTTTGPTLNGSPEVPAGFSLWDDGTANDASQPPQPDRRTFNLTLFGNTNAVGVTEGLFAEYDTSLRCQEDPGGLPQTDNSTPNSTTATRSANITAEEGEIITCTYTNKIKAATLKVIKVVTNNNGGSLLPSSFSIHVKTGAVLTGVTGSPQPGAAAPGTSYTLPAATYVVSEDDPTSLGYAQSSISGDCDASGNVTLAAGDTKTCTITNDDIAPSLTIVKRIKNDSGGTKAISDFTITTSAGSFTFDGGAPDGQSITKYIGTTITGLTAGAKTLIETDVAGYAEGTWGCTGATGGNGSGSVVTAFNAGSVTLKIGDTATCTITNDDDAQNNGSSTAQSIILNDSASITSIRPVSGTTYHVTFRLYFNLANVPTPTCSSPIYTAVRDLTLSNTADPLIKNGAASTKDAAPAGTPDTGSKDVTQSGKYYWTVAMASDANNNGVTENCGKELTNLTINDNAN